MSRVLVTGANGFVGGHLCTFLAGRGYEVIGAIRSASNEEGPVDYELRPIGDIENVTKQDPFLNGIDYVVHLAARVHVLQERQRDPLDEFRRVNVIGTERLLGNDYMRGVKRFVYVSTVKVHGELTHEAPFSVTMEPAPADAYAQSKLEAEQIVAEMGTEKGIETVIIRPPLVYGPGVGANFASLLRLIDKGYALPLGSIGNKRSLVGIGNLCDLIGHCLNSDKAAGGKFLASDNFDVSTPELFTQLAEAMSRPVRLFPVPVALLKTAAALLGRSTEVSKLLGSLQVDVGETMRTLAWTPPNSFAAEIQATVDDYLE
jgi:UDP-glucose 4-epimerase